MDYYEWEKLVSEHPHWKVMAGDISAEDQRRFTEKYRVSTSKRWTDDAGNVEPCWVWTAATNANKGVRKRKDSYGVFRFHGVNVYAHRFALFLAYRVDPGPSVDHLCHNTLCVNPMHLRGGSVLENNRNRRPVISETCIHGHLRTEENTYVRKDNGRRQCKDCARVRDQERYNAKYAKDKTKNTHSSEVRDFAAQPKLDREKVSEIRRRHAEGESQRSLARAFYVSQPMIGLIVRNEAWKE